MFSGVSNKMGAKNPCKPYRIRLNKEFQHLFCYLRRFSSKFIPYAYQQIIVCNLGRVTNQHTLVFLPRSLALSRIPIKLPRPQRLTPQQPRKIPRIRHRALRQQFQAALRQKTVAQNIRQRQCGAQQPHGQRPNRRCGAVVQRLSQNRQIFRQRGFQAACHVYHRAMRQRLFRHSRQTLRHIIGVHRLHIKPPARRQHQHRQSRQLNKQLATRAAAPKHHTRAGNVHPQAARAHRRIAAPFAADKRHIVRRVRAQC